MNETEYKKAMECFEPDPFLRTRTAAAVEAGRPRVRPLRRVVMIACVAALAVGCILSIAAGLPTQAYHFIIGGSVTINPGTNTAYYQWSNTAPAKVEADGRLWLTTDGQHLDITDLISENTPYIYTRTDPDTGAKGYLVLGGTSNDLGWMEWYQIDGDWFWHAYNCLNHAGTEAQESSDSADAELPDEAIHDGTLYDPPSSSFPPSKYAYSEDAPFYTIDFRPWVVAANEQLAAMGIQEYQPQVD